MNIQCQCGSFRAKLSHFPTQTPGRMVCYCDDCQTYLHFLKKQNLLDENGGTEIVPVYPINFHITAGAHHVRGVRLSNNGLYRWYASCCQTPIANTQAQLPWIGLLAGMLPYKNQQERTQNLGKVKNRVLGKFAHGQPPLDTSSKFRLRDFLGLMPFILKGLLLGKSKNHPFLPPPKFEPIADVYVLSTEERQSILKSIYTK